MDRKCCCCCMFVIGLKKNAMHPLKRKFRSLPRYLLCYFAISRQRPTTGTCRCCGHTVVPKSSTSMTHIYLGFSLLARLPGPRQCYMIIWDHNCLLVVSAISTVLHGNTSSAYHWRHSESNFRCRLLQYVSKTHL